MITKTFGIRHHGPGSARRLRDALHAWQPDVILLETPTDAQPVLEQLAHPGMRPPVALVLYDAKDIERAAFYPFATFSPEYQAIRYATERDVPLRCIDLPARHFLAPDYDREQLLFDRPAATAEEKLLRRDPLALVARLAGYRDSESWWDATLERAGQDWESVFAAVLQIVGELRATYPQASDEENERREAWMRNEIRKAAKEGFSRAAVVVGAWHGPAVADPAAHKASTDRARLRGLPRTKIGRAWVPWSFPRLARQSGYGAGVHSPAYYHLLYQHPTTATDRWMTAAAQLLRSKDFDASPAMATEAVGLAQTLATLREHERPGIAELEEALLGTLAAGSRERLRLIHDQLTVGDTVGSVPEEVTTVPLLEDLRKEIRSTRLTKYWETTGQHYLKATKTDPRGGIDLRTANDLRKSHLLHRMNLLELSWGVIQPLGPDTISSFREIWLLEWQPEFSLGILERSSYGNTLAVAATVYARERAEAARTVHRLSELLLDGLRADLPDLVPPLLELLGARAAETTDVTALLAALPSLITTSRYGDSRGTDTTALLLIIDDLLPRLAAGLPAATAHVDEEQAESMLRLIAAAHQAVAQLANPDLEGLWLGGLERVARGAAPLLEGYATRLLYDGNSLDEQVAAARFSRALSTANGAAAVANWVAGFLHGGGQLLLHHRPLWELLDGWVATLIWEDFERVLPLLRRTFADFGERERRGMMRLAGGESVSPTEQREEAVEVPGLVNGLLDWL